MRQNDARHLGQPFSGQWLQGVFARVKQNVGYVHHQAARGLARLKNHVQLLKDLGAKRGLLLLRFQPRTFCRFRLAARLLRFRLGGLLLGLGSRPFGLGTGAALRFGTLLGLGVGAALRFGMLLGLGSGAAVSFGALLGLRLCPALHLGLGLRLGAGLAFRRCLALLRQPLLLLAL